MEAKHMKQNIPSDDEIRRILIRKKKRKLALRRALIWALLLFMGISLLMVNREHPAYIKDSMKSSVETEAEEPKLKADAAEIYSLDLQQAVYQKNADEKIDPYSITKVLTCYLVLENVDPDQKVKITENKSEDYVDGSHILLLEGEELTVRDLLHATMMASANDAAYYLAVAASGSEKKFADLMNETVKEWGCENTHFVNPNGWKNKNHYTTAHDMSIITARCFESEALRELASTKEYTIKATEQSEERNLINYFYKAVGDVDAKDSINWGKTGSWEEDDCSIVLEYKEDHLNAAIVLLRDSMDDRSEDIEKLMEYSHKVTPGYTVTAEGEVAARTRVKGGAETGTELVANKTIIVYPRSGKEKDIKVVVDVDDLEAPLAAGEKAGTYKVIVDGAEIDSGELLTSKDIAKGGFLSRFYISDHSAIEGAVAAAAVFILRILLGYIRARRRKIHRPEKH